MRYTIKLQPQTAVLMNRNSTEYTVELDIVNLTEEQRVFLASKINSSSEKVTITNNTLLDSNGNLTQESIQAAIDKVQDDINKTFERAVGKAEEKIRQLENDPSSHVGYLFDDSRCQNNNLSKEQIKDKEALLNRVEELKSLYAEEEKAKVKAFDEYITPLIEAYENGERRPIWEDSFIGTKSLLDRILAEDKKREQQAHEAKDNRKYAQLTEVVNQFGTELQKRKWASDMMERKEAVALLWKHTFEKGNPLSHKDFIFPQISSEDSQDWDEVYIKQDYIEKLSDEEFEKYEEIISMYPDFNVEIKRELAYESDAATGEYLFDGSFVRLSKIIGEYEMIADFLLK